MNPVHLAPRRAGMVVARDGEVDARWVDVGESVKRERRLMGDDAAAEGPRDGSGEIVVFTARQDGHAVHTASRAFKTPSGRQKTKLHRIDANVPRITRRDVAMLLSGNLDESIPDRHVRNRIKLIRLRTHMAIEGAARRGHNAPEQ